MNLFNSNTQWFKWLLNCNLVLWSDKECELNSFSNCCDLIHKIVIDIQFICERPEWKMNWFSFLIFFSSEWLQSLSQVLSNEWSKWCHHLKISRQHLKKCWISWMFVCCHIMSPESSSASSKISVAEFFNEIDSRFDSSVKIIIFQSLVKVVKRLMKFC